MPRFITWYQTASNSMRKGRLIGRRFGTSTILSRLEPLCIVTDRCWRTVGSRRKLKLETGAERRRRGKVGMVNRWCIGKVRSMTLPSLIQCQNQSVRLCSLGQRGLNIELDPFLTYSTGCCGPQAALCLRSATRPNPPSPTNNSDNMPGSGTEASLPSALANT